MRFSLLVGGMLLAGAAWAQQPALPGAPQPPALPGAPQPNQPASSPTPRTTALPTTELIGHPGEVIGQTYSVETVGGTLFSGTLREATEETLTFETRELGVVTLQRANLRQLMNQTAEQVRRAQFRRAERAAEALSVRLVLPLGLCCLPAFMCWGVLPVLMSLLPKVFGS